MLKKLLTTATLALALAGCRTESSNPKLIFPNRQEVKETVSLANAVIGNALFSDSGKYFLTKIQPNNREENIVLYDVEKNGGIKVLKLDTAQKTRVEDFFISPDDELFVLSLREEADKESKRFFQVYDINGRKLGTAKNSELNYEVSALLEGSKIVYNFRDSQFATNVVQDLKKQKSKAFPNSNLEDILSDGKIFLMDRNRKLVQFDSKNFNEEVLKINDYSVYGSSNKKQNSITFWDINNKSDELTLYLRDLASGKNTKIVVLDRNNEDFFKNPSFLSDKFVVFETATFQNERKINIYNIQSNSLNSFAIQNIDSLENIFETSDEKEFLIEYRTNSGERVIVLFDTSGNSILSGSLGDARITQSTADNDKFAVYKNSGNNSELYFLSLKQKTSELVSASFEDFSFLDDGNILFTERDGNNVLLKKYVASLNKSEVLIANPPNKRNLTYQYQSFMDFLGNTVYVSFNSGELMKLNIKDGSNKLLGQFPQIFDYRSVGSNDDGSRLLIGESFNFGNSVTNFLYDSNKDVLTPIR